MGQISVILNGLYDIPLSNVSVPSYFFTAFTTILVTGRMTTSYAVLRNICSSMSFSMLSHPIPQNANGKNTRESTVSPQTDETTARSEKRFPPEETFILLMIHAFTVEPDRKASREAIVTLGARANI